MLATTLVCKQHTAQQCEMGGEGGAKILQNVTRLVVLRLQMLSTKTMDVHAVQSEYQLHEERRKKPAANAMVNADVASAAIIVDNNIRAGRDGSSCGIHVSLQHTRGTKQQQKKIERYKSAGIGCDGLGACADWHSNDNCRVHARACAPCRASRESWRSFQGWDQEW